MSNQKTAAGIPPLTHYSVIFPFSDLESKFSSEFYSPNLTDEKASTQEIVQVLSDFDSIMKPFKDKSQRATFLFFLFAALCFLPALYFWVAAVERSTIHAAVLLGSCLVSFIAFVIWDFYINKISDIMKLECKKTVERHNLNFAHRGLRWYLPTSFPTRIELWKDYSRQQINISRFARNPFQQRQSGYVPPVPHSIQKKVEID